MQQIQKTRQRTKRSEEEVELSFPTASLSDTSATAELVSTIDEILTEV